MDILEKQEELNKIFKENGIKFAVLFGSRASGRVKENSDFDLAVLTSGEKNIYDFDNYCRTLEDLSKVLKIPEQKIDLTNLNNADPLLRYEIMSKGVLLGVDGCKYAAFKSFALRDYIATFNLRELERKLIFRKQDSIAQKIYV